MRSWIILSTLLITSGIALFLYKVLVLHYPLSTAGQPGTWRVEMVVTVTGGEGRTVAEIPLPRTSGYQRLLAEEVRSGPLRFSIDEVEGRRGRWSGKLKGSADLSYEVAFDTLSYSRAFPSHETRNQYPESVAIYLSESPGIQTADPLIAELSRELLLTGTDKADLATAIYNFVAHEIGSLSSALPMDALTVVQEGRGNDIGRARLACSLARVNGLPCRVMAGIALQKGRQDRFRYWNEVYLAGSWAPFDAADRHVGTLPADRLALAPITDLEPVTASGTSFLTYRFYVQPELETYAELVRRQFSDSGHFLDRLSLLLLPVQLQHTLRILLLIPLGALVMCTLRNVIGLKTFGMFMPMLIALALTGTGLIWGTVFLVTIVGVSLVSRIWIDRLYLLLAARIAFVLSFIVLLMVVIFLVGDRLGIPSAGVGAFPFVIMTMIVERISVSLEEEGWANTLRRVGATLVSIYLTYAVLHVSELQTIFLVFPETLLVILGLLVALGRYTGYRLTELVRFRDFVSPSKAVGP